MILEGTGFGITSLTEGPLETDKGSFEILDLKGDDYFKISANLSGLYC